MPALHFTDRALKDLDHIDRYSIEQWGNRVAAQYLEDIGTALDRITQNPDLIAPRPEYSLRLGFYRVRKHVLVCDRVENDIYVLTIFHTSMDLPARLVELEQQLVIEVEMLRDRI